MSVSNKGHDLKEPETREVRSQRTNRKHSEKPSASKDPELHKTIMENIRQINGEQMYNVALKNLRLLYRADLLSQNSFEYYKKFADQHKNKAEKKSKSEIKSKRVAGSHAGNYVPDIEQRISKDYSEDKRKLEDKTYLKARERKEYDKEYDEKLKDTPINRFRSIVSFFKSPMSRIFLFVILGVFLLFYLTRNSMANTLDSSLFLILTILFMVLILGKGGKTRNYNNSSWF